MENVDEVMRRISNGITKSQSIALLEVFRHTHYDTNHNAIMTKLWNQLSQQKHLLNHEHYKHMLRYYAFVGDANEAQAMFDTLTKIGYIHNS